MRYQPNVYKMQLHGDINDIIQIYSGITSGGVLDGELFIQSFYTG